MKRFSLFFLLAALISLWGCEKHAGEGGTSEIRGKVYVIDYDQSFTHILSEYYAPEEDVYIIYGNDDVYSDDFETHYDGTYRFRYLQKGKYTVFAYSKSETAASGVEPVKIQVEIREDFQTVELEDLVIFK